MRHKNFLVFISIFDILKQRELFNTLEEIKTVCLNLKKITKHFLYKNRSNKQFIGTLIDFFE